MNKDVLEDIRYQVFWLVGLDKNGVVNKIKLFQAMDMSKVAKNEWSIFVEFSPSKLFVERAKEQIREMDWSKHKPGTDNAAAYSYLYGSDPDNPVSSNDTSR
jgi:hypothetical protein